MVPTLAQPSRHPVYKAIHRPLTLCGLDRRLFFGALMTGVAVFNLSTSLVGGLLATLALYATGLWGTVGSAGASLQEELGRLEHPDARDQLELEKKILAADMVSTLTVELSNLDAVRQVARVGEIGLADGPEVAADDQPPARLASSCDTLVRPEQDESRLTVRQHQVDHVGVCGRVERHGVEVVRVQQR